MLLIFLGVNYVPRISALSSAKENAVDAAKYAESDFIERHPPAVARPENNTGSDWIERHPSTAARLDDVFPVDSRAARTARLVELARIKDEAFPVDTRAAWLARQEELARIKDEAFPVDTRAAGLARQEELARI